MIDETDTTSEVARVLAAHQRRVGPHGLTRWCTCYIDLGTTGDLAAHQAAMLAEAGLLREETVSADPCNAEVWSMDHYRDGQVDPYWIRCTQLGPHTEHEDSNTGLTWAREAETPAPAERPRRLRACVENWPDAETGAYNPSCCRFPKSCSATVYDEEHVTEADLEPRTLTSDEGARA